MERLPQRAIEPCLQPSGPGEASRRLLEQVGRAPSPARDLQVALFERDNRTMPVAKLITVDGQPAVVLPDEALQHLHASKAAALFLAKTAEGLVLHRCDTEFHRQMTIAEAGMREYCDALSQLAK